jgi:hypothetical protein
MKMKTMKMGNASESYSLLSCCICEWSLTCWEKGITFIQALKNNLCYYFFCSEWCFSEYQSNDKEYQFKRYSKLDRNKFVSNSSSFSGQEAGGGGGGGEIDPLDMSSAQFLEVSFKNSKLYRDHVQKEEEEDGIEDAIGGGASKRRKFQESSLLASSVSNNKQGTNSFKEEEEEESHKMDHHTLFEEDKLSLWEESKILFARRTHRLSVDMRAVLGTQIQVK